MHTTTKAAAHLPAYGLYTRSAKLAAWQLVATYRTKMSAILAQHGADAVSQARGDFDAATEIRRLDLYA